MAASAMFDHLERLGAHRRVGLAEPRPWSSGWMVEHTGATYRQLDWWIRHGLFRRQLQGGSGSQRRFTPADFEIATALAQLAALGATHDHLEIAARTVWSGRVAEVGERLVLLLDGTCYRHRADRPVAAGGPMWVVPLMRCPFSPAGVPTKHASNPAGDTPEGAA